MKLAGSLAYVNAHCEERLRGHYLRETLSAPLFHRHMWTIDGLRGGCYVGRGKSRMARGSRKRKELRRERRPLARPGPYLIAAAVAAVAVVVLIVAGALSRGGDGGAGGGPVILPNPRPAGLEEEGHLLGSAAAPVTIVEYADFQ
jgi:hypothetical protein